MSESQPDNSMNSKSGKLGIGTEPKLMEFSDFNDDAIGMIIDKLELKERLILRKVSRGLRGQVDQKKSILKKLHVTFFVDYICVRYDDKEVAYVDSKTSQRALRDCNNVKLVKTKNHLETALDDLHFAIKSPTVLLDKLDFRFYHDHNSDGKIDDLRVIRFSQKLKNILKSLDHKISTKKFTIHTEFGYHVLDILPHLEPGTLKCIEFRGIVWSAPGSGIDQIFDLDQWKQATKLCLKQCDKTWPEEHLMHFKKFKLKDLNMCLADVLKWRDFFSKSTHFESCNINIGYGFDVDDPQNHLGDIIFSEIEDYSSIYIIHHPMATDSNQILEIRVWPETDDILFTKIARPSS